MCVFRLDKSSQNKFEAIVHKMKKNLNVFVPGSFFSEAGRPLWCPD